MERRDFLAALAAPALVPAGLSASTLQLARLKTPVVPELGPESYFWVEREYYEGELHAVRIIGNDEQVKNHRKLKYIENRARSKSWKTRISRVRFSPLKCEKRFLLARADWHRDWGPSYNQPRGPVLQAEIDAYWSAAGDFANPVSLLDVPHEQGDNELYVSNSDWLTRENAFSKAAEYNAESASKHLEEHGYTYGCHWWTVVEFGRPVAKPLVHLSIECGIGEMRSNIEYPVRLVEPTEAEKARYPFKAVLKRVEPSAV